jgi:hypothetical protein
VCGVRLANKNQQTRWWWWTQLHWRGGSKQESTFAVVWFLSPPFPTITQRWCVNRMNYGEGGPKDFVVNSSISRLALNCAPNNRCGWRVPWCFFTITQLSQGSH